MPKYKLKVESINEETGLNPGFDKVIVSYDSDTDKIIVKDENGVVDPIFGEGTDTYTNAQIDSNFLSASTNYVNPDVAETFIILRDIDPISTGNTYKIQISGGTMVANIVS